MVRVGLFGKGLVKNGGVSVKYGNTRSGLVSVQCGGEQYCQVVGIYGIAGRVAVWLSKMVFG